MTFDHLKTLYGYRNLIWVLAWGEFKQRYKNSVLGYFWSLLEPLLMLVVLYVVFSNLMRIQVEYYQLFLLLGIILWNFLSRATSMGLNAILGKPGMVQKIYFPREILVISSCITALLMSIFESLVFIAFMAVFQVPLSANLIYVPLILVLLFLVSLGLSLALAALNVFYRDVQFIWAVLLRPGSLRRRSSIRSPSSRRPSGISSSSTPWPTSSWRPAMRSSTPLLLQPDRSSTRE